MNEKFKKAGLAKRIATGLVLAAVLITGWSLGGWYITGVIAVAAIIGMGEFLFLFERRGCPGMKCFGLLLGAAYLSAAAFLPGVPSGAFISAAVLLTAMYALFDWSIEKNMHALQKGAVVLCGLLYVPAMLAPAMHFSRWEQLLIVLVPAISDIAAYFAGVSIGRHPVWPGVSPKKSFEGCAAGFLAAVATACVLGMCTGKAGITEFAVLGAAMAIASQFGDFFESALKRAAGVKDSSNLLPGHGGVLDRLDSIVFSAGTYAAASALHRFFG